MTGEIQKSEVSDYNYYIIRIYFYIFIYLFIGIFVYYNNYSYFCLMQDRDLHILNHNQSGDPGQRKESNMNTITEPRLQTRSGQMSARRLSTSTPYPLNGEQQVVLLTYTILKDTTFSPIDQTFTQFSHLNFTLYFHYSSPSCSIILQFSSIQMN